MYPSAMIQEIAYARAAELQRSAGRSRSARAAALAAREQDVLARRRQRSSQPDGPIVTARPVRPRAAVQQPTAVQLATPVQEPAAVQEPTAVQGSAAGQQPGPARQPVGVAAADADARELASCTTC